RAGLVQALAKSLDKCGLLRGTPKALLRRELEVFEKAVEVDTKSLSVRDGAARGRVVDQFENSLFSLSRHQPSFDPLSMMPPGVANFKNLVIGRTILPGIICARSLFSRRKTGTTQI